MQYTEIRSLALSAAATLIADENVGKLTEAFVKANGVTKRGPHRMAIYIKGLFTPEQIKAWPAIGSKREDFPAGYNGPTDFYKYQEFNTETGKNVNRSGSFINDMADHASKRAKDAIQELEYLKPLCGKDAVSEDKVVSKYRHLIGDKTKALNLQTHFNNELKAARSLFRQAVMVIQQETALAEFKSVKLEYDTDKDGNITDTIAPFVIVDAANPRKARNFTNGGFLALDFNKAEDNFESIIGTTKKGTDDANKKQGKYPLPKTTTDFLSAGSTIVNYLDNEQNRRDEKLALASKDRDAHILMCGDLHHHLDNMMGDPDVAKRYAELKRGQQEAAKAAA